jgi:hypothetical protein
VLALGSRQSLVEIGRAGVHELFTLGDAKVERPALRRANATYRIGAHNAPAWQAAVAIQDVSIEPQLGSAEVSAEHAQVQRRALRIDFGGCTRHSHKTKSTIGLARRLCQLYADRRQVIPSVNVILSEANDPYLRR